MKKQIKILFVSLILASCGGETTESGEGLDSISESSGPVTYHYSDFECPWSYDASLDVSDSIILIFDEVLEKGVDFNENKFNVAFKNWEGKSFSLSGMEITNIYPEESRTVRDTILVEPPRIICRYGTYDNYPIDTDLNVFMNLNSAEEAAKYDVGQKINIRGCIQYGSAEDDMVSFFALCGAEVFE
jgi:hypothetical protein